MRVHHITRRHEIGEEARAFMPITLPGLPGIIIDGDRSATTPRQLPIRVTKPVTTLHGAAAQQVGHARAAMFRAALIEVMMENQI